MTELLAEVSRRAAHSANSGGNSLYLFEFLVSSKTGKGLGTEDLNACTAVIIASPTGAILGHFFLRPPGACTCQCSRGGCLLERKVFIAEEGSHVRVRDFKKKFAISL